jgi:glycosyltransferase involved in cell wall biosynthesis
VLEAISYGLSVVCLDLGGPGEIVNHTCGRVVQTSGKRSDEVIVALARAIKELATDWELRQRLSDGAFLRAEAFRWDRVVRETYADIQEAMGVRAHRAVTRLSD